MGKFLTKKVGDEEVVNIQGDSFDEETDENEAIAPKWNKIVKPEAIKSMQAKQLEEAVKSVYAKAAEEAEELDIKASKPVPPMEKKTVQIKQASPQEEKKTKIRIKKPVIFEEDDYNDKELAQSSIDQILLEYFGDAQPQYEYAKRLKRHIDKKIDEIKNYQ